jgi:hypothetical protein
VRLWRAAAWIATNVLLWIASTAAFGYWINRQVREEYRLGYRVSTDGDSISIPIALFAFVVGALIVVGNALWLLIRVVRRRRYRPGV